MKKQNCVIWIDLIDDGSEDKKAKHSKKCIIKRKLKFENCKNCLKATQLENKINCPEKNNINIASPKKSQRIHKKQ